MSRVKKYKNARELVEAACIAYDTDEPITLLMKATKGVDPRYDTSELYELVWGLAKEGRPPTDEEWAYIRDLVLCKREYRHERIPAAAALDAAKSILPYIHPKPKPTVDEDIQVELPPMTEDDIRAFRRVMDDEPGVI